jgi:hypothetical protein
MAAAAVTVLCVASFNVTLSCSAMTRLVIAALHPP